MLLKSTNHHSLPDDWCCNVMTQRAAHGQSQSALCDRQQPLDITLRTARAWVSHLFCSRQNDELPN
jgi:hypothetical protein